MTMVTITEAPAFLSRPRAEEENVPVAGTEPYSGDLSLLPRSTTDSIDQHRYSADKSHKAHTEGNRQRRVAYRIFGLLCRTNCRNFGMRILSGRSGSASLSSISVESSQIFCNAPNAPWRRTGLCKRRLHSKDHLQKKIEKITSSLKNTQSKSKLLSTSSFLSQHS